MGSVPNGAQLPRPPLADGDPVVSVDVGDLDPLPSVKGVRRLVGSAGVADDSAHDAGGSEDGMVGPCTSMGDRDGPLRRSQDDVSGQVGCGRCWQGGRGSSVVFGTPFFGLETVPQGTERGGEGGGKSVLLSVDVVAHQCSQDVLEAGAVCDCRSHPVELLKSVEEAVQGGALRIGNDGKVSPSSGFELVHERAESKSHIVNLEAS